MTVRGAGSPVPRQMQTRLTASLQRDAVLPCTVFSLPAAGVPVPYPSSAFRTGHDEAGPLSAGIPRSP